MPDKTNENDYRYEDEQQEIHLNDLRQLDEYARAAEGKIDELYAETETTMDADDARMLDVDRMDLKEEEDYINKNLQDGCYIDGREVAAIHNKYEKHMGQLQNELKKAKKEDPEKANKIADDIDKLKESRNGELQKLCDETKKYSGATIRKIMKQQLKDNDAGRAGGEVKIYRKEKGHDGLLVTTYGKNRVGELNKWMRKHDEKAAELAGRKAGEQKRQLGHSAKEFMRGDAESMFKGSVSMGLHALLFMLNKASQAGNKSAQWALYLYARNKLTMDDAEALQNALDDVSQKNIAKNKEGDMAEQKTWNGTIEPMDFNRSDLPAFRDMELCDTYTTDPDIRIANMSYIDSDGTRREGYIYRGTDDNIRQYLSNMGLPDDVVDAELAENAAKEEALGMGKILPMDFSDPNLPPFEHMDPLAYYDAEHDIMAIHVVDYDDKNSIVGKVFVGSEDDIRRYFADKGMSDAEIDAKIAENTAKVEALGLNPEKVHGQGYEEYMLDEDRAAYEEHMGKGADKNADKSAHESTEYVIPLSDEDICTDILGEEAEEAPEAQADLDDVGALLNQNKNDNGSIVDAPTNWPKVSDVADILNELGDDGKGDR